MSQLNPNAAEFVPISPTRTASPPPCVNMLKNDPVLAQSPREAPKVSDIKVPELTEFVSEIKTRPCELFSNGHQDEENVRTLKEFVGFTPSLD